MPPSDVIHAGIRHVKYIQVLSLMQFSPPSVSPQAETLPHPFQPAPYVSFSLQKTGGIEPMI